jgi:general stress protein YciG
VIDLGKEVKIVMTDTTKQGLGSDKMDPQTKHDIQSQGGQASSSQQDMSALGQKGGQAAQQSGNAHKLTQDDQSKGGQNSPTNFANRPKEEVEEIASKGGQASHGGGRRDE